jgi:hypothetical protein
MKTRNQNVTPGTRTPDRTTTSNEEVDYLRYEFSKGYVPVENPKSIEPDDMDIK